MALGSPLRVVSFFMLDQRGIVLLKSSVNILCIYKPDQPILRNYFAPTTFPAWP